MFFQHGDFELEGILSAGQEQVITDEDQEAKGAQAEEYNENFEGHTGCLNVVPGEGNIISGKIMGSKRTYFISSVNTSGFVT